MGSVCADTAYNAKRDGSNSNNNLNNGFFRGAEALIWKNRGSDHSSNGISCDLDTHNRSLATADVALDTGRSLPLPYPRHHHIPSSSPPSPADVPVPHDSRYYSLCFLAGGASSSIRWIQNPLEVVKVNMQTEKYGYQSLSSGLSTLWRQEGMAGMTKGLAPTAVAYICQTGGKYGCYEVLKDTLTAAVGGQEHAKLHQGLIYIAAAATAEAIADVLMCPWEMLKVKVQTSCSAAASNHPIPANNHYHPNHHQPRRIPAASSTLWSSSCTVNTPPRARMSTAASAAAFPTRFGPALATMIAQRQQLSFPFGSLRPIWGRQIPGTIANFYIFENAADYLYENVLQQPKSEVSPSVQLGVTFCAGYLAGFCSAAVSHPADSLISQLAKPEHTGKSMRQIVQEVGFVALATKGLGPRVLMVGSVVSGQWLLYDSFKSMMGLGTSGGGH